LEALHATRDDVSDVFLTHGHFDHVAASPLCKKAKIHVGAEDVDLLAHRQKARFAPRMFSKILPVPPIEATDPFKGRTELSIGDKKLVAIPLPGHTPGSYVLLYDGVLFAGDSMQISDGKLDFAMASFSADMDANRKNVAGLKAALGDASIEFVCTGHQGCTAPGEAPKLLDDLIARAAK
jgi:glyoxylase-like metal-dependent hydrolase (beta-lactamase superfamily II)